MYYESDANMRSLHRLVGRHEGKIHVWDVPKSDVVQRRPVEVGGFERGEHGKHVSERGIVQADTLRVSLGPFEGDQDRHVRGVVWKHIDGSVREQEPRI